MDNDTARDYIDDLIAERNQLLAAKMRLEAQVDALMDVKRAAQALVDFIHYQQNKTSANTFHDKYQNLIQALNAWYNPNGTAHR